MSPNKGKNGASSSKGKEVAAAASTIKVKLQGKAKEVKWEKLSALDFTTSRYPCRSTIRGMGNKSGCTEMCVVGSLNQLFSVPESSYRALTLEFLTTMKCITDDEEEPEEITFRLRNKSYTLTVVEINQLFHFHAEGLASRLVPNSYNRNEFWNAITLSDGEDTVFHLNRAKINQVQNPTLCYMLKEITFVLFGRYAGGILQQDDLLVLWSLLYGRTLNLGQYLVMYLDRQFKKMIGGLGCGRVITSIAKHYGVDLEGYVVDQGPMMLNWAILRNAQFLNVDVRLQGYILQKKQDHFLFPDVQNTTIHRYQFWDNWRMDTEAHSMIIRSNPAHEWASTSKMPATNFENPSPVLPF